MDAAQLADCRHLNAVGAILPAKAEFAQDVFERADRVVVDDLENARRGSRELRERYGVDAPSWPGVSRLSDVLAAGETRAPDARLTLFKGMGMGLSDLAMATVCTSRRWRAAWAWRCRRRPARTCCWRRADTNIQ